MMTVQLGYNERIQDKIDLREVIDLSTLESEEIEIDLPYDASESFELFLQEIGH